ncbi:NAD(P)/FAD-dependent oxidoreductase [Microbispora sp. ATCC PTA-5024]|uniref:NAD(P)/FAD-dependent oxidoreductase n=1 Tax=Microbispora sp. ATCC PTA-5024 TaxID=316330 RepID=UPI0003DDB22B|nr:NAD(P)/FAD-dependent oxidoreductase [Microbispora sp. ATCC PTA-5024]ETK36466.1 ferredoxin [Microbispora sp. ATCC PTA-5024]
MSTDGMRHGPLPVGAVDVAVIGAGVVGAAVARELAGYDLSVALVEARCDVGDGTSKANTAILHTGFDATPGTLESRLVRRGYDLLGAYAAATGIPVERTGAVLVAWTEEELAALPGLAGKAAANGCRDCAPAGPDEVYAMVPALGPGVLGGLTVPGESIVCPWTTTLAFATEALARGVHLLLNARVEAVARDGGQTVLSTSRGPLRARWVVNAAGLGSDAVDGLFGHRRFTVTPRRGELLVFDKAARPLADRIVLPVPGSRGKGVLISPTVYGNVMLGPTAEELEDRMDTSTSEDGFAFLAGRGRRLMPALLEEEVTAAYAGLRAATEHGDYQVHLDPAGRYLVLGGIRSTGLTASMALAEHAAGLLAGAGLALEPRAGLPGPPRMPNIGEAFPRPYQRADLVERDPAYGTVVCFCERVTAGEVRDALAAPLPPGDLDGLRRRTRATMGRCQGFHCGAEIDRLLREGAR